MCSRTFCEKFSLHEIGLLDKLLDNFISVVNFPAIHTKMNKVNGRRLKFSDTSEEYAVRT